MTDPAPRASLNIVGVRLGASTQPLSSDGQKQKTPFLFSES